MSNLLYNGFKFDELISKFELKNISPIYLGEIGQMKFPLLNNQDNGYVLNTSSSYNTNPDFLIEKQININNITLVKYDGTNDIFKFYKDIDLQNAVKIKNSLDPIDPQDLVTKSFLESSIGGFGKGSVTSVGVSVSDGLSVSNSPITSSGNINLSLSNNLQVLSSLGYGADGQVIGTTGSTYVWRTPTSGTVTSVGLTTSSNGLSISNSPITASGNININLSSQLQAFNTLGYGLDGQVIGMSGENYSWTTPASGGNVTGSSTTAVNSLALWNNTTGTMLGSTNFIVDSNGDLNLNNKRIISANSGFTKILAFTTNVIFNIPNGITRIKVTLIGGGGGGGCSAGGITGYGGGGAGGGLAIKCIENITDTSLNIVVGIGGLGGTTGNGIKGGDSIISVQTSSGLITVTATGGDGGSAAPSTANTLGAIAIGGIGIGGDVNLQGQSGGRAINGTNNSSGYDLLCGLPAGNSPLFSGAGQAVGLFSRNANNSSLVPASNAGTDGTGGGGSGGAGPDTLAAKFAGAKGGSGIVIIEY